MNGFYSLWTAPYFKGNPDGEYSLRDHELLMLLLSVAAYQKYNGSTAMYADGPAAKYILDTGIEGIFKNGLKDLNVSPDIDPKVYWAAGKLEALKAEKAPSVMIDTDLIIWKNLDTVFEDPATDIAVIHREEINPKIYPGPCSFEMKKGYSFPSSWDFSIEPANTALLYIKDEGFKVRYVDAALEFMKMSKKTDDTLCHMVFAEQRILPMCAASEGKNIFAFCNRIEELREQRLFTHMWGHKNVLKFNGEERHAYCLKMMMRLKNEFPEMYEVAEKISILKLYRK
ncbi:MAG: hypothetical protein K6C99_06705 [Lachnospiraceae bacterium]|nr:hypothetical protein [Lachnospiraceae bacterium]